MCENVNINISENKVEEKVTVMTKKAREGDVAVIYSTKEAGTENEECDLHISENSR